MSAHMRESYQLEVPWMSWLSDRMEEGHDADHRSCPQVEQRICRVYAHRLSHAIPTWLRRSESNETRWVTIEELGALPRISLRHAGYESCWAKMWTTETDAAGLRVMRGFGVANHRMRYLRFQAPPNSRGDVETDAEGRYVVNAASLRVGARM